MNPVNQSAVLIIEDEFFIAMDLEQCLRDLGHEDIVIASSLQQATAWLALNTPVAAILDISLKDGSCTSLARMLVGREVPFIVSSGLPVDSAEPVFSMGYRIPKPYQPDGLKEALISLDVFPVKLAPLSVMAS